MNQVEVTMLNTMADRDFLRALDLHVDWGIYELDLKDSIFGHDIARLPLSDARRAAREIKDRGLHVHCLSTTLFETDIEVGHEEFVRRNLDPLTHALEVAYELEPNLVRLIAAGTRAREEVKDGVEYVTHHHPWLIDTYRDAIELVREAGFVPTIENESGSCILSSPAEVLAFFDELGVGRDVTFTWDVVNMWKAGTYPSVAAFEQMSHLIGYFHVKGGKAEGDPLILKYKSSLEDATWPVREMTSRVIAEAVSPVICINPPKGANVEDLDPMVRVRNDIDYLRRVIREGSRP